MRIIDISKTSLGVQMILRWNQYHDVTTVDPSHAQWHRFRAIAKQIQSREGFDGLFYVAHMFVNEVQLSYVKDVHLGFGLSVGPNSINKERDQ